MNLKDFISTTFSDINSGIEESNKLSSIVISPSYHTDDKKKKFRVDYEIVDVEFDVALTTQDKIEAGATAGLKIIGVDGNFSKEGINYSRVKFSIPIGIKKI